MRIRFYLLSLWQIFDPIYYAFTRLTYLDRMRQNVFRVRLTRYKGRTVTLSDGTCVQKGDLLLKVHLYNVYLLRKMVSLNSELQKGKFLYRCVQQSLPELALHMKRHSDFEQIKGVIGITMLHKGCKQLGFETFDIVSSPYKWYKWITLFPIYILSVAHPLRMLHKHDPKYLFMSKQMLFVKYSQSRR